MIGLSLAMIVRNEEVRLTGCLASVLDLADEMIVVDTGSSDGTPDLARSFGAQVIPFPWCDDFSAARNTGLQACRGRWILVLDADERLDQRGVAAIRQAIRQEASPGHLLTVRNYLPSGAYLGIHGGARENPRDFPGSSDLAYMTEFPALRLFRRHESLAYSGRIHELVDPSFEALGWKATALPAVIHHFGKAIPDHEQAKQKTYYHLATLEAQEHPGDPRAQYNLMQEAAMVEAWLACAEAAQAYVRLQPRSPLKVRLDGSQALRELGRLKEAQAFLNGAEDRPETRTVLLVARGELFAAEGREDDAVSAFLEAIELNPHFTLPFLRLATLLRGRGDFDSARQLLEAGLDQNPKDLLLWEALVGLSAAAGDLDSAARDAWNALAEFPQGGRGLWHQLAIRALQQKGAAAEAAAVLARGLSAFPDDPGLRRLQVELQGPDQG